MEPLNGNEGAKGFALLDPSPLMALGYSPRWEALFEPYPYAAEGLTPGRVIRGDRGSLLVATSDGVVRATPSSRLLRSTRGVADLPAVGDWVAVLFSHHLDRVSAITRGDPGKTSDVQVLAANIDTVFVVHPIAEPPNLRRIERELSVPWDSGAVPMVVLTEAIIQTIKAGSNRFLLQARDGFVLVDSGVASPS